jgi:hypothetical protein
MQLLDARASEPVEDAELFFTQPFVCDERLALKLDSAAGDPAVGRTQGGFNRNEIVPATLS